MKHKFVLKEFLSTFVGNFIYKLHNLQSLRTERSMNKLRSAVRNVSCNTALDINRHMQISASILNTGQQNEVKVTTNIASKQLLIPAKTDGNGSSVNGGELLFLALATCFCNDIYREAIKRRMQIKSVEVIVSGEFGGEGKPGLNIQYEAKVDSDATEEEIKNLIFYVDKVAEVHNTLRVGTPVTLNMI